MGPNTGGMGVYSPVPAVDAPTERAMVEMLRRTVDGLRAEGIRYRGVLYGGFMLTADGPKVLEYNARFGDPETQVILPRMRTDLVDVMLAVAEEAKTAQPADVFFADEVESGIDLERRAVEAWLDYATFVAVKAV